MVDIEQDTPAANALRDRLAGLIFEIFLARCRLDSPRNECRRPLLAARLDVVDARASHIAARLLEAGQ